MDIRAKMYPVSKGSKMIVSHKRLREILESLDTNTVFSVTFVKRTTGEERTIVCRLHVHKDLKGGPAAYDPKEKGLLWVWDMQKEARRSINLESLIRASIKGVVYQVRGKQK